MTEHRGFFWRCPACAPYNFILLAAAALLVFMLVAAAGSPSGAEPRPTCSGAVAEQLGFPCAGDE